MPTLNAVLRYAVARENLDETPLTPEEQLMVAPPDEQAADPEVAEAIAADTAEEDGTAEAVDQLLGVEEEATQVVDVIRDAGDEVSPEAIAVAAERLNNIFARVGLSMPGRRSARESADSKEALDANQATTDEDYVAEDGRPGPYSDATDLISDAEKNLEFVKIAANEGIKEFINRIAVNSKNFLRWRTAYAKEAATVAAKAGKLRGATPKEVFWNNRLRIAHFTNREKTPLVTADALSSAVKNVSAAVAAISPLQAELSRAFKLFGKGDGSVDIEAIFNAMPEITTASGVAGRAVSGGEGIFGEEAILAGFGAVDQVTNFKELRIFIAKLRVVDATYWRVKDLPDNFDLPVMPAAEVEKNARALVKFADQLASDYAKLGVMKGRSASGNSNDFSTAGTIIKSVVGGAVDAAINRDMVMVRERANTLTNTLVGACAAAIDLKAKALNCLLDYYKWSLANHQSVATESHQLSPAKEGFAGGVIGLLVDS